MLAWGGDWTEETGEDSALALGLVDSFQAGKRRKGPSVLRKLAKTATLPAKSCWQDAITLEICHQTQISEPMHPGEPFAFIAI